MLMEMLFGAGGLSQLKMNVLVCARRFQLHLIRLIAPYVTVNTDTHKAAFLELHKDSCRACQIS